MILGAAADQCEVAADDAVPVRWQCANPDCRATTASKRRGPRKEFCSKNKCKELAAIAVATLKEDTKDQRLAELEQQLLEQATTIAVLKQELARAQAAPIHRVEAASSTNVAAAAAMKARPALAPQPLAAKAATASAPAKQAGTAACSAAPPTAVAAALSKAAPTAAAAGMQRPLAALSLNVQQPAQQPAKKAKPSELPPEQPMEYAGGVPRASEKASSAKAWQQRGWSTRPSRSRPGECTWVHEELGLTLREAPKVSNDGAGTWHVSRELVKAIIESFYLAEQRPMKVDELYADFQACVPLKDGAVSRSKSLRTALKAAREEAASELEAEWDAAGDALCEWLEGARDAPAGRSVHDAAGALGWTEQRVRGVAARLEKLGDIYSTIDGDHFAVTEHTPVSPAESPPHDCE